MLYLATTTTTSTVESKFGAGIPKNSSSFVRIYRTVPYLTCTVLVPYQIPYNINKKKLKFDSFGLTCSHRTSTRTRTSTSTYYYYYYYYYIISTVRYGTTRRPAINYSKLFESKTKLISILSIIENANRENQQAATVVVR